MDTTALIAFATALFSITNPIGNTAVFASMTGDQSSTEQQLTARKAAAAIAIVLLVVLWAGRYLLDFFGISIAALETAGGLIVLSLGLSMLHSEPSKQATSAAESDAAESKDSIAVVPLAIPIVAGPGAITTVLVTAGNSAHDLTTLLGFSAISVGFGVLFWICFHYAASLSRLIGVHGIAITTRIMGMVLAAIACIMITNGLKVLLPGLA